ncbi:MAG: cobalamin-independent methionine synthase II family protein, partial [Chloroflexota bacterium]
MTRPAILTTVVGSYPVPEWLRAHPSAQALRDATATAFHTQELAGIDLPADGELYRFDVNHPETNGMIEYFVGRMSGIRRGLSWAEIDQFSRQAGMGFRTRPPGVVEAEVGPGTLALPLDCRRARELAGGRLKFTLTGPHMLAKTLVDRHYGEGGGGLPALTMDIAHVLAAQVADLDADVVQVDEANITGHPEEAAWASEAMNVVLDAVKTTAAVHLCFGNYAGQPVQRGTWASLIGYLAALHVDHVVLEMAVRPEEELAVFGDLPPSIGIGAGVIDIKTNRVETPDDVARRIDAAARRIGPDRIRYAHPDCGFWMLPRVVADAKLVALVQGRDQYLGH